MEDQVDYIEHFTGQGFWGLGLYELKIPIKEITTHNRDELESLVKENRELYLTTWDWIYQFPPSETSGKTHRSQWERTLRYPKFKYLPPITQTYQVERGLVHLTQGVDPDLFDVQKI